MDRRRTVIAGMVAVAVLAAAAGWIAGRQIDSPEEAAVRAAAPAPSTITVPVESRVLSSNVVVRGDVRFSDSVELRIEGSPANGADPIVTGGLPEEGDELAEGDVAVEVASRPLFVLRGTLPAYRTIGPGMTGDDVLQLEQALLRLGLLPGSVDGTFDEGTETAVEQWYRQSGFDAIGPDDEERVRLKAARDQVSSLQTQLDQARDALGELGEPVSGSQLLSLQTAVTSAQRAVDSAFSTGSQANIAAAEAIDRAIEDRFSAEVALDIARQRLDLARGGTSPDTGRPPTPAELSALQSELSQAQSAFSAADAAVAAAIRDRDRIALEGQNAVDAATEQLAIAQASLAEAFSPADATNEQAAVTRASADLAAAQTDLAELEAEIGVRWPQSELVFVQSLPRRVDRILVDQGVEASGALMEISGAELVIDSAVAAADRPLLSVGDRVRIEEEGIGIDLLGEITELADQPGTDGVSEGRYAMKVMPEGGDPAQLRGINVRITIPVESTSGEVLAVPLAALSATADGKTRVEVEREPGTTEFVDVTVGLSAQGFAEVTPIDGDLQVGDQVVVGGAANDDRDTDGDPSEPEGSDG